MAQGIRAGRAFVELFADDSKLVRGLRRASARLKAWGAGIRSIGMQVFAGGAAIAAPLLLALKQFTTAGDALDKMSSRVGASVEFLSALSHAAQIGGTDISAMEVGIRRLQRTAFDAQRGLSTATDAFDALGISVVGADGQLKSTEDLFMESATALSRLTNNTQKAALATVIFGRAGTQLLPMLKDGADGMVAVMEEAHRLGLVMSTEDATAAAELTDAWTRLTSSFKMAVIRIGGALAPSLTELADRTTSLLRPLIDWIRRNKELLILGFKVAAVVMAVAAAFVVVGAVISGIGATLGVVASVVTGIGTALGLLATVLGAILSPIGLVIAGITAIGAYLIYTSGVGGRALAWLGERFAALKETAFAAFGGISDALAAGDIGLAARILWLTLKMEWQKGVNALNAVWLKVKDFFLTVWTEAVFGAAAIATNAWAGLQTAWLETVDVLADAWALFTTGLTKTWNRAVGFIRKAWVHLKSLFDSEIDVDAEVARINAEIEGDTAAADAARDQQILDREQRRRARRSEIESGRSGALQELEQMREAEHAARQRQHAADLQTSASALDEARRAWRQAIAEAARKRGESAGEEEGPGGLDRSGLPDGLPQQLAATRNIDFGLTSAQKQAIQLQALGAGRQDPEEQTAKNTEQMIAEFREQNKILRDLLAQQRRTPPTRVATIG